MTLFLFPKIKIGVIRANIVNYWDTMSHYRYSIIYKFNFRFRMDKSFSNKELPNILDDIDFEEELDQFQESNDSDADKNNIHPSRDDYTSSEVEITALTQILDDAFTSEDEKFNGENEK